MVNSAKKIITKINREVEDRIEDEEDFRDKILIMVVVVTLMVICSHHSFKLHSMGDLQEEIISKILMVLKVQMGVGHHHKVNFNHLCAELTVAQVFKSIISEEGCHLMASKEGEVLVAFSKIFQITSLLKED